MRKPNISDIMHPSPQVGVELAKPNSSEALENKNMVRDNSDTSEKRESPEQHFHPLNQ